ncbi:hypothetical protein [Sphingopyxis sp.]|uniref:hypothetical protein n=1 Tax=Sphingopyxis sp. TaxID=1908224 RepID=UPI0035B4BA83
MAPVDRDARSILLNIFLSIYLVPLLVLLALGGRPLSSLFIVAACSLVMFQISRIRLPSVEFVKVSPEFFLGAIAFLSVILIMMLYFFLGFKYFNIDFREVYNFREDAAENLPSLFSYLSSIFSKALIPLGVVSALLYRQPLVVLGFAVISLFLFGFTSHKSMIFYPLIAAIIYYSLSRSIDYSKILILLVAAMAVCVIDVALMSLNGPDSVWGWYTSLLLRRALFVPPLLDFHYIEFFSNHPLIYWADSRLTFGLLQSPYDLTAPYLIGNVYFGDDTGANTGFIGSGFAQAGLFGALLYSAGAGLTLALLNAHGRRQGVAFISSVTAIQMVTMFSSTDFVTLFLSHGVLLSFLLLGIIDPPQLRQSATRQTARVSKGARPF